MYVGSLDQAGLTRMLSDARTTLQGTVRRSINTYLIESDHTTIPDKRHEKTGKTYVEMLFTTLACGGPDTSSLVVLCALSKGMTVEIHDKIYVFQKGVLLRVTGAKNRPPELPKVRVSFQLDPEIWDDVVVA